MNCIFCEMKDYILENELAYAIYDCKIPVISAVGHETDFTICDFVSDLRAPTPSAAAELAVPDKEELLSYYNAQLQYISSVMDYKIQQSNALLSDYKKRISLSSPQIKINEYNSNIEKILIKLDKNITDTISKKESNLVAMASKLEGLNPISILSRGYSIAEKDGKVINSKSQLKKDDLFTLEFSDGKVQARVMGE